MFVFAYDRYERDIIVKNKRKIYIVGFVGILILILVGIGFKGYIHYFYHVKESKLYKIESAYRLGEKDIDSVENSYDVNSGEYFFIEGLKAYDLGNYLIAVDNFEKAAKAPYKDRALATYLYYYRNLCIWEEEGIGDLELVTSAMREASEYVPLANDTQFLWELISSISLSSSMDDQAIELIESYLQDDKHLELVTWAWLKNYIAMLEYNNEEYANSIRNFYDVEVRLEKGKLDSELEYELQYAKEYIANIYVIFQDYEKAAMMYDEIYRSSVSKGDYNSYGCCINMASAYLEIDDTNNAKKAMKSLEKDLDKIDPLYAPEVEANIYDIYANIYILENDFKQADEYLKKAEEFYVNNRGSAFFGGEYFIALTRTKYLVELGKTKDAKEKLDDLVEQEEISYLGLEEEFYDLYEKIYEQTGNKDELIDIYKTKLENEKEFITTTQREYLKFSEYYRENTDLRESNSRLYRNNFIVIVVAVLIFVILIFVLVLVRMLSVRNVTDQLTGVYNRKKLNGLIQKYENSGTPADLAVVMIDIDYFKRYNDTYGHQSGDMVLKEVAEVLQNSVRKKDTVIRYGGEEFLVLLHGIKKKAAQDICHKIQDLLKEKAILHSASEVSEHVTMSMGLVFQKTKNDLPLEKLIGYADECLYQSKEAGRNRLTVKD